jgi:hypothetical protein
VSGGVVGRCCSQVRSGGGVCGGWRSAGMFKVEMSFFFIIILLYLLKPVLHEGRLQAVEGYPS